MKINILNEKKLIDCSINFTKLNIFTKKVSVIALTFLF